MILIRTRENVKKYQARLLWLRETVSDAGLIGFLEKLEKKTWIIDLEDTAKNIADVLKHIFNWIE